MMLTVDLGIQVCLINSQMRSISFFEGSAWKICVSFSDEQAAVKAIGSPRLGRQSYWVSIKKY